ncbi:MAG: FHA domain-containing protein [Salinibacterium sp.]|nr:FHA domain-containing protein [Salinibacterium sp.]
MVSDADDTVLSLDQNREVKTDEIARFGDTVISVSRPAVAPVDVSADPAGSTRIAPSHRQYEVWIGESVITALDVPVILGRRPRAPRIVHGPRPRLVAVDSPAKVVSASHLSIRQLGSSLVITDLRSTNGSVVTVPPAPPRRLRQGESIVVTAGAQVDIGDGNVLYVLEVRGVQSATDAHGGSA